MLSRGSGNASTPVSVEPTRSGDGMRRHLVGLALVGWATATHAWSQPAHPPSLETLSVDEVAARYSPDYARCMSHGEAAQGITSGLLNCKQDELSRRDAALNLAYGRLRQEATDAEGRGRLAKIEREWLSAKAAVCQSEMDDAGEGTASSVEWLDCQLRLTARREAFLNRMLKAGGF